MDPQIILRGLNLDRHLAQPAIDPAQAVDGPPAVQVDIERTPHSNPPKNDQSFTQDGAKSTEFRVDRLRDRDTKPQKQSGDNETDPAVVKKLFEFATVHFCTIGEIVSDRLGEDLYSVGSIRALAEMNNQFVGFAGRVLLGPADDELLSFAIEVPLMKGGWIHRVKDLVGPGLRPGRSFLLVATRGQLRPPT